MFLQMYQTFIGIYDLFQVYILIYNMHEGVFCIIFLIHANDLFECNFRFYDKGGKDAAREISPIRNKVDL